MQKAELQIKQEEVKIKGMKTMADIELDKAKLQLEKDKAIVGTQKDVALEQARLETQKEIVGAQIGAKAEMEQKQIITKEVLEGAKLGAAAVNKQKDINLREKESQLRNTTKVKETKLKDDNNN